MSKRAENKARADRLATISAGLQEEVPRFNDVIRTGRDVRVPECKDSMPSGQRVALARDARAA